MKKVIIIVLAALIVLTGILILADPKGSSYAINTDGEEVYDPYQICIDGKAAALVSTEEEGNQIIEQIKEYYPVKGEVVECTVEEELTVTPAENLEGHPMIYKAEDTLALIMDGKEQKAKYIVMEGDTLQAVAKETGVLESDIAEWNREINLEELKAGDELVLYVKEPLVHVQTTEKSSRTEVIDYRIKYVDDPELAKGEKKVVKKGQKGKKEIVSEITRVNGKKISEKVASEKTVKKPVTKVVHKGSKVEILGTQIVDYAKQYLGAPYVWGGSSLETGVDSSGLTKAVYEHFGITLPHSSYTQRSSGTSVTYEEAEPGDIIIYDGHVGIYEGNGMVIHAIYPNEGVAEAPAQFRPILDIRRID